MQSLYVAQAPASLKATHPPHLLETRGQDTSLPVSLIWNLTMHS
jgi:hypothetical protein